MSVGNYTAIVTDSNGCEIEENFEIIYEDEDVVIDIYANSEELEICEDESITLIATNEFNFINYQWMHDGIVIADNSENTIDVNVSGNYSVEGITADGCEATSEPIEIIVNENPVFNINGPQEVLTGNISAYYVPDNGNEYYWSIKTHLWVI